MSCCYDNVEAYNVSIEKFNWHTWKQEFFVLSEYLQFLYRKQIYHNVLDMHPWVSDET